MNSPGADLDPISCDRKPIERPAVQKSCRLPDDFRAGETLVGREKPHLPSTHIPRSGSAAWRPLTDSPLWGRWNVLAMIQFTIPSLSFQGYDSFPEAVVPSPTTVGMIGAGSGRTAFGHNSRKLPMIPLPPFALSSRHSGFRPTEDVI